MASERGTSIIDWLSEVEASSHMQDSSPSLSCNTHSQPTQQSLSLSSPCFSNLQHPHKRKHHPDSAGSLSERLYFDRRTRKAFCEIMPNNNNNKRRRTGTASEIDEQENVIEPQTPQKGSSSSSSQSILQTPTASLSILKTPSSTRNKAPPTLAKNAENIRDTLEGHGMWYDDVDSFVRYPQLKGLVEEILANGRGSGMADSSVKKVLETVKQNYTKNEKTHFNKVRPLIIKVTRSVIDKDSKNGEGSGAVDYLKREFEKDGLEMVEDENFTRQLLPLPETITNDKAMGLTNPKPDFTFGIVKPKRFPLDEVHVPGQIKVYLGVAPSMRFPFYIEEYKSAQEGIVKAEHQAMRDGATLVNARMKMNQALKSAGWVSPVGADMDSFVFSCAWTPDIARIFVNWHERLPDGKGIFHMTRLGRSYPMDYEDHIKRLRHDIENILDWGLLKHKQRAQQVWDEIVDHFTRLNASQA